MSNIPQDVVDDAKAAGLLPGPLHLYDPDFLQQIVNFAELLRAKRSNAEPVAIVNGGVGDARLLRELLPGTQLYTASPDYAAGMMKAAEICDESAINHAVDRLLKYAFEELAKKIRNAIPADSKAALREVCMKVAEQTIKDVAEWPEGAALLDSEVIVNSVLGVEHEQLEGK